MRLAALPLLLALLLPAAAGACEAVALQDAGGLWMAGDRELQPQVRLPLSHGQLRTITFAADCRAVTLLTEDGWVTGFTLPDGTLRGEVRVAEESAGMTLSADGAFLMVGNRRPGTLVSLNAGTLAVIRTMEVTDTRKHSAAVGEVRTMAERRAFWAALAGSPELWEIPYTEDHEPIYNGFVHSREKDMVEGFAEPGPFPARKLRYPGALADLLAVRGGRDVVARGVADGRLHHLNLLTGTDFRQAEVRGGPDLTQARPFDHGGREVLAVPLTQEAALVFLDVMTLDEVGRVPTDQPGARVAGPDARGRLWLSLPGSDAIRLVDTQDLSLGETVRPAKGEAVRQVIMAADGTRAFVVTDGALLALDALRLEETARLPAKGAVRAVLGEAR